MPNLCSILACLQLVEHIAIRHTKSFETSCKCPICSALTEGNEIAYASAIKSFPNNSNFDSGKDFITKIADDLLAFSQCTAFLGCFRLFGTADDGYVQQFVERENAGRENRYVHYVTYSQFFFFWDKILFWSLNLLKVCFLSLNFKKFFFHS